MDEVRRVILAAVGILCASVLVGCTHIPADELPTHAVIQKSSKELFSDRQFAYLNGAGRWTDIECKREGLFAPKICRSDDGDLDFTVRVHKSMVRLANATSNGKSINYFRVESEVPESVRVWSIE